MNGDFIGRMWITVACLILTISAAPYIYAQDTPRDADVVLAVDLSGSMNTSDRGGNRLIGADKFLSMSSFRPRTRAGVVSFGNDAVVEMPLAYLSSDRAGSYQGVLEGIKRDAKFTELGHALLKSKEQLGPPDGRMKSIVVISDGIVEGDPNRRGKRTTAEADADAEREIWRSIVPGLKNDRIIVYSIGLIGNDSRGEPTLKKLASETGGFYRRVTDPKDFTAIYEELLFNIGQGSAIDSLISGKNTVRLSVFDESIIISGPSGMSVASPGGTFYPQKEGQHSPVKQYFVTYKDGSAILFLGRPGDAGQVNENWSGPWTVTINGNGKMIRFSKARLVRDPTLTERRMYFKNEFVPIRVKLALDEDDTSVRDFLNKCTAKYTIVSQDADGGWTKSGSLTGKGNVFEAEEPIDRAGNHLLQVQLYSQAPDSGEKATLTYLESFEVNNADLLLLDFSLETPDGEPTRGDKFKVIGRINPDAFNKESPEMVGFSPTTMDLKLKYNSDSPTDFGSVKGDSNGFRSQDSKLAESGELAVQADMTGDLIMRKAGRLDLVSSPVKIRAYKNLSGIHSSILGTMLQPSSLLTTLFFIAAIINLFVFVRHEQWKRFERTRISDEWEHSSDFAEGDDVSIFGRLRKPIYRIGGPQSNADKRVEAGGGEIIAEIGVRGRNRYYIKRVGETEVFLDSRRNPLERNQKVPIDYNSQIIIGDESFHISDIL